MNNTLSYRLSALGMVNSLGDNVEEIAAKLFNPDREKWQTSLTWQDNYLPDKGCLLGKVLSPLPELSSELANYACRLSGLSLLAFRQISDAVSEAKEKYGPARVAVVMGSSTSGIEATEEAFKIRKNEGKYPDWYKYVQQEHGSVSRLISLLAGVTGPAYTISTACSSSAKVFASAKSLLRCNMADAVIVGGVDSLCQLTVQGFASLELVSSRLSNPMSCNRDGLNLGEGASLFLLTNEPGGVQLLGVGESSDAYHLSAPHPEGKGARQAMLNALEEAKLSATDITYVNLHGTGTKHNDLAESHAVNSVFGDGVPCSSTKPETGHLLGASGATEVGFCWMALSSFTTEGKSIKLPAHHWDNERDPELALLRLVSAGEEVSVEKPKVLSNSFAFGGSNCCVILGAG